MFFKKTLFLFLLSTCFPLLFVPSSFAQSKTSSAVFVSVSGKVTVTHGKKSRKVHKDSTAAEGDSVSTAKNSTATLRLFDGSELQLMGSSRFTLQKLAKVSAQDKDIQLQLSIGKIFAKVKKLFSPSSSFEIEAGGVIAGVRGTEYEVDYDPGQDKVDIFVKDGNVWAKAGGGTFEYGAGKEGHFHHGNPDLPTGDQGKGNKGKDNKEDGDKHERGREGFKPDHEGGPTDAFHGFEGNREDPLRPLAGLSDDLHRLNDKTGDDQLLGVGAHTVLIKLKYPEQ